jgi:lysophospholipase L1-like esterase
MQQLGRGAKPTFLTTSLVARPEGCAQSTVVCNVVANTANGNAAACARHRVSHLECGVVMRLIFACVLICCNQLACAQDSSVKRLRLEGHQKIRIALVGDSTVTDGSGWGRGFKKCLTEDVECINAAQNGRSSKSYRAEGRWKPVLAMKPDLVLLQFGHNDQPGKGPERESPADTEYRANMRRYVEEARAAGIQPILVTSLVRRKFAADGTIHSDLCEYVEAVKQAAAETKTPLIDLHDLSLKLCNSLGPAGCKSIDPVDGGKQDTTHLNERGSEIIGKLVAEELVRVVPELAPSIRADAAGKSESTVN